MGIDTNKVNNYGIIGFIIFIVILVIFSGFVFFNNSSNLEVSIRSNDEQLKRSEAVTEALTKNIVEKNEAIKILALDNHKLQKKGSTKDSVINIQSDEIKKLQHDKDSLTNLVRKFKWSDIEPVNKSPKQ
jgi:hypothetical protein